MNTSFFPWPIFTHGTFHLPMAKFVTESARVCLRTRFISTSSCSVAILTSGTPTSAAPRVRLFRRARSRAGPTLGYLLQLLLQLCHSLLKLNIFVLSFLIVSYGQNITLTLSTSAGFIRSGVRSDRVVGGDWTPPSGLSSVQKLQRPVVPLSNQLPSRQGTSAGIP